jgi:hypothetical protein
MFPLLLILVLIVVTYFSVTKKKLENINIYIKYSKEIQKIIGVRKGCWNAEKRPN